MYRNDYHKEKDLELDSLIDGESEFRYYGIGDKRFRVLFDRNEVETPFVRFKVKKTGMYFSLVIKYTEDGERVYTNLGRYLLGLRDPNLFCDHINRNTLDNRRCNLRAITPEENARNRYITKGKSGYKNLIYNGTNPTIEYEFSKVKNRIGMGKYQNPFLLAIVADCIMMKNDSVFCTTNFDKKFYTDDFIDFILAGMEINL